MRPGHKEKADRVEHTGPHRIICMRRAGKVDDFLQENWVDEDGDVVDELEAAGHEEAEAKADDQWTEN